MWEGFTREVFFFCEEFSFYSFQIVSFLSYFFVKRYLLSESMLWVDVWVSQSVSQSVSQWEMYVFHTSQIRSTINSQSNFSLKRLMVCGEIWFRYSSERPYFFFYKRGRSIHILGLHRHFLWVRLRILGMDKMSLEVSNSRWATCMQMKGDTFIFSYKGNLILLFFSRGKFN